MVIKQRKENMKILALQLLCLICMHCHCNAQAASSLPKYQTCENKGERQQSDSTRENNEPSYKVLSVENMGRLRWTGKAFTGQQKKKANTWLMRQAIKGMDAKWFKHALWLAEKDVCVLNDSLEKDWMTIIAVKSAEKGWNISNTGKPYFIIDECKAPLYAVPYFINGRAYFVCFVVRFSIVGNQLRPNIDREALYENVLKPLIVENFP